jgi:UDP-GlcNAc:undecaprenyl-phosphate/decaprenyl-phosphate GlcNAc-1-phosphate transferase
MYSLLFLFFASCVLSLTLTPLVRNAALRLGVVDLPDHDRKIHKVPIPRVGGVAILTAAVGSYALLLLVRLSAGHIVRSGVPSAVRLMPAVIVIFAVGLIDDIFEVRPLQKLAAQIIAALLAWAGGIHLAAIGGHPFPLSLSFVVTLVWIVACSNAVNLIDGVDGLATGISLFATISTLIAALLHRNIDLAFATVPLAGALLGFLRFNFSPASIFLGDCGSLTLGFLLGCYGIVWSEKSTTVFSLTAPLLALSVPLLDSGLAIARRALRHKPIFRADREHIHHKLLSLGLTPRRTVLVLYAFCGLATTASLLLTTTRAQYHGFVIVLLCLSAWLGLQHLGYSEFAIVGRLPSARALSARLKAQFALISWFVLTAAIAIASLLPGANLHDPALSAYINGNWIHFIVYAAAAALPMLAWRFRTGLALSFGISILSVGLQVLRAIVSGRITDHQGTIINLLGIAAGVLLGLNIITLGSSREATPRF